MPETAKAAHYVELLDHARCDEKWEEVPELVRKVRKHAPARDCLTLTAEIEHAIATCSQAAPTPSDHVTENETDGADAPVLKLDVAVQVPKLVSAIDAEIRPEDRFQAQACLVWLHWIMRHPKAATENVPKHYGLERGQQDGLAAASEWTRVCALRSVYLEANCQVRGGERDAVARTFNSALPSLTDVWTTQPAHSALRYWSELFLTECCLLVSQTIHAQPRILTEPDCLGGFRAWAKYWANQSGTALAGGYGFKGSVPRRQIWAEYYAVVSQILQNDLPYPTGHLAASGDDTARSQLRMELKKVEVIYQGLLFTETKFPRADEDRKEVEEFVECLMQNWVVLTGRGWKARDLGPGGRESISRGVLDSLYGAAMKTFHSTAILRHLFMVHLGVAEFELAFKSFDAYLDLVEKSKARAEKTGHTELSGDDDEEEENEEDDGSFLETMAVCISALCQYGDSEAAEKARHLASELEKWLARFGQHLSGPEEAISPVMEGQPVMKFASQMPPGVFALAWQSIGLAYANWAKMTFDSESRGRLQDRAILCLRRSLSSEFSSAADIRGVFALALLYAEQRKLSLAIELVKAALLAESATEEGQELYNGPYWRERALVPLWHLLALMLSARQEYGLAARTCEGAMEQFRDAHVLFGGKDHGDDETNEGLVDDMDDYEKEGILEIKMTQLALLELVEGPVAAVNASRDLLALFPRLFGTSEEEGEKEDDDANSLVPPKAGTLRSFRNSVFGGGRSVRSEQLASNNSNNTTRRSVINNMPIPATHRPATMPSSAAPAIHVTNTEKRRSRSGTLRSNRMRDGANSRPRSSTMTRDSEPVFMPMQDMDVPPNFGFANKVASASGASSSTQNKNQNNQMTSSHSRQVSNGSAVSTPGDLVGLDVSEVETFAALLPRVQFPSDHDERKRGALLIKVWLVISAFYRKAERFGNAQESCAEALRIVQSLETDVARDTSGSLSARNAGWGERKSIDELLADVWCERAYVTLAMQDAAQARTEFETALTYYPDHPSAIVGLSHMLLDVYEEKWRPKPTLPDLSVDANVLADSTARLNMGSATAKDSHLPTTPLGLATTPAVLTAPASRPKTSTAKSFTSSPGPSSPRSLMTSPAMHLPHPKPMAATPKPPPRPAVVVSLPLVDRLAARDRAHGLLSGLTKLGSGWNRAEAWFALARALEASGQPEKAKVALWWCVELADSAGAREWACVGGGGYIV